MTAAASDCWAGVEVVWHVGVSLSCWEAVNMRAVERLAIR